MARFTRTRSDGVWRGIGPPTIAPPVVPASGSSLSVQIIVITGTNFQYTTAVNSSGFVFASWVVDSPTQITVTTLDLNPIGVIDITVVTDTGSVTLPNAFTFT